MTLDVLPAGVSYSQLTDWLDCQEKYRLRKVAKVPETPAWALVGGSAVHLATEVYDRTDWTTWEAGVPNPESLFRIAFEEGVAEGKLTEPDTTAWRASGRATKEWPNKQDEAWWRANGPLMVENWIVWRHSPGWKIWTTPDGKPAIELEIKIVMGGRICHLFIDRLMVTPEGELGVLDIKSGATMPDSPLQLGLYATAVEETFGQRPSFGTYFDARNGVHLPGKDLSLFSRPYLDFLFGSFVAQRELRMFIPNPGRMCVACGVRDFCPAVGGTQAWIYHEYR